MTKERNKHRELCGAPYLGFGYCTLWNEPNLCSTVFGTVRWTISRDWVLAQCTLCDKPYEYLGYGLCVALLRSAPDFIFGSFLLCGALLLVCTMQRTIPQFWVVRDMRWTIPQGMKNVETGDEKCWNRGWTMLKQGMKNVETGDEKSWNRGWTMLKQGDEKCWNRGWKMLKQGMNNVETGDEKCWNRGWNMLKQGMQNVENELSY